MAPWLKLVLLRGRGRGAVFCSVHVSDGGQSCSVGVVGGESVQVPQLTQAALDVCYVDLYVVLETTEREKEKQKETADKFHQSKSSRLHHSAGEVYTPIRFSI